MAVIASDLHHMLHDPTGYVCECGWMRQTAQRFVTWSLFELLLLAGAMWFGFAGRRRLLATAVMVGVPVGLVGLGMWDLK